MGLRRRGRQGCGGAVARGGRVRFGISANSLPAHVGVGRAHERHSGDGLAQPLAAVVLVLHMVEGFDELLRGLEAGRALLGHELEDDAFKLLGNGFVPVADGFGRVVEQLDEDQRAGGSLKGHVAGGHFVKDDAEREEIGTRVEGFAAGLFGRHVGESAYG